jgi:hypothetical protein
VNSGLRAPVDFVLSVVIVFCPASVAKTGRGFSFLEIPPKARTWFIGVLFSALSSSGLIHAALTA